MDVAEAITGSPACFVDQASRKNFHFTLQYVLWTLVVRMNWMKGDKLLAEGGGEHRWRRSTGPAMLVLIVLMAYLAGYGSFVRGGTVGYPKLPVVNVKLGQTTVKLWVAASAPARDRGLMYIRKMPNNRGMLFVFHRARPQTFWMRHTLIPLDLLFLNQHGVIVGHDTMQPDNGKKLYPSGQPVRFAIELNAGVFKQLRLHNAMRIRIPPLPATATVKPTAAS